MCMLCVLKGRLMCEPCVHTECKSTSLAEEIRVLGRYCITNRRHVNVTFNEIRHILNLAQIHAIKTTVKLVTFDGDQTLYADGE